jgi:hypothetical protein
MANDNKAEPFKSVLLEGTEANFNMYGEYSVFTPDTEQTAQYPGLLVYLTGSGVGNGVTLADAFFGDGVKTDSQLGIIEIPLSHPSFPKSYDKATAFTALVDTFKVHWLRPGDKLWVKSASISATTDELLFCAAAGLVAKAGGTTTIDKYNVHAFRPLRATSSKTWTQVEYVGRVSVDSA